MSTPAKPATTPHQDLRVGNLYRVAIVGAGTLKGKEVAEVLNDRNFPAVDVKLLDDDEALGQLEAMGDEVTFIQNVRNEQFDRVDFTFFASNPDCTRNNWKTVRDAGSTILDLSFALEDEPDASVRSPWIERELATPIVPSLQPGPIVAAHPASVVLALVALRAGKAARVDRMIVTVYEPASEHGQKGMDELHEQTVNLLSFQQLPKAIFDTQVAFNMVSRYGEKASATMQSVEQRILRHYERIAGKSAPKPSLLLLQAPIFHGHVFGIYLEFASAVTPETLEEALAGEHITVTKSIEDSPSNVNAAGQGGILVAITTDPARANGLWLWAATDNLRIGAVTAVECAESMVPSRPKGQIQ
jgi:aspartate-semialdehyde dehydrogenase